MQKQPRYENFAKLGQQDGFYQSEKKKYTLKEWKDRKRASDQTRTFQHQHGLFRIEM